MQHPAGNDLSVTNDLPTVQEVRRLFNPGRVAKTFSDIYHELLALTAHASVMTVRSVVTDQPGQAGSMRAGVRYKPAPGRLPHSRLQLRRPGPTSYPTE